MVVFWFVFVNVIFVVIEIFIFVKEWVIGCVWRSFFLCKVEDRDEVWGIFEFVFIFMFGYKYKNYKKCVVNKEIKVVILVFWDIYISF